VAGGPSSSDGGGANAAPRLGEWFEPPRLIAHRRHTSHRRRTATVATATAIATATATAIATAIATATATATTATATTATAITRGIQIWFCGVVLQRFGVTCP